MNDPVPKDDKVGNMSDDKVGTMSDDKVGKMSVQNVEETTKTLETANAPATVSLAKKNARKKVEKALVARKKASNDMIARKKVSKDKVLRTDIAPKDKIAKEKVSEERMSTELMEASTEKSRKMTDEIVGEFPSDGDDDLIYFRTMTSSSLRRHQISLLLRKEAPHNEVKVTTVMIIVLCIT